MNENYYWIEEKDGVVTVGLTDEGRNELGNITFVSLPKVGDSLTKTDVLVNVEADKAVSDIPSPVEGTVIAINEDAVDDPSVLNNSDRTSSWVARIEK
ncbi:glycine cleavage system protein H [Lentilactobacillus kosonis]|uniref:Glycine cleavage system H protein n=1 Tax=Lentilactobacillus kosonis TaxID=2810561 RepID=A0A401FN24_9LACO|nr:glycine cleavage system protein H [Lentilactobacillus kosonis]GAY73795.1 glycine cleavage system H protein [Lentilactobacillus kosonis]